MNIKRVSANIGKNKVHEQFYNKRNTTEAKSVE